jgi:hypothetical protein
VGFVEDVANVGPDGDEQDVREEDLRILETFFVVDAHGLSSDDCSRTPPQISVLAGTEA